jgi:predicted kinase
MQTRCHSYGAERFSGGLQNRKGWCDSSTGFQILPRLPRSSRKRSAFLEPSGKIKPAIMELILFIGLQATGKSSFYRERFFRTHVRINLDMLGTRHRAKLLLEACIAGQTKGVADNTNLTRDERAQFILPVKTAGFRVVGYFFESRVAEALRRNAARPEVERVPDVAIPGSSNRLQLPSMDEGFDELFFVRLMENNQFNVEGWRS